MRRLPLSMYLIYSSTPDRTRCIDRCLKHSRCSNRYGSTPLRHCNRKLRRRRGTLGGIRQRAPTTQPKPIACLGGRPFFLFGAFPVAQLVQHVALCDFAFVFFVRPWVPFGEGPLLLFRIGIRLCQARFRCSPLATRCAPPCRSLRAEAAVAGRLY